MRELPSTWAESTVGECFLDVRNGTTVKQNKDGKGLPVSRIETIQNNQFDFNRIQYVEELSSDVVENFRYRIGDIAFSHINSYEHVGKTALYDGEPQLFVHGMNLLRLRLDHQQIEPKFAHLFMRTVFFREEVRKRVGHAVNQVSINQKNLAEVPFVIAPIQEQRRIVAKLERLLVKVDDSQRRLTKIPVILKRFRQSVLAAACSGRLTADWRKDDSTQEELPITWRQTVLNEVGEIVTGNTPSRRDPGNFGDFTPWVKPSHLDTSLPITKTEEGLSQKGAALARLLPPGAVLVSCIGNLGKVAFAGTTLATNQQINAIVFDKQKVLPRYGYFFCQTLKPWMEENSSATTLAILNKGRFSEAPIAIPPIAEQEEIVRRVEALFTSADKVQARHQKGLAQVDKLTQSILAKAFRGELVPQDPNDEPASELLKRIKLHDKR